MYSVRFLCVDTRQIVYGVFWSLPKLQANREVRVLTLKRLSRNYIIPQKVRLVTVEYQAPHFGPGVCLLFILLFFMVHGVCTFRTVSCRTERARKFQVGL